MVPSRIRPWLWSGFITFALLFTVELGCLIANHARHLDKPFLFGSGSHHGGGGGGIPMGWIDPLLGPVNAPQQYEHLGENYFHGFAVHGDPNDRGALRIVTLGGSTTEPMAGNWSRHLYELLHERGVASVVYNGGVSSYGSAQEMLKLVRDGVTLEPAIVISYDGVNDVMPYSETRPNTEPVVHSFVNATIKAGIGELDMPLLPNTFAVIRRSSNSAHVEGIEHGVPVAATSAQMWHRHLRTMKAVSEEFHAHYFAVLQPALGVGSYRPSEVEGQRAARSNVDKDYSQFYPEAQRIAAAEPWIEDLTEVFAGHQDIFTDNCHVTDEGNRLVAKAIFGELERRGWLTAHPR